MKPSPLSQLGLTALALFVTGFFVTVEYLFAYIEVPERGTFALMIAGVLITAAGYALGIAYLHEKKEIRLHPGSLGNY